MLYDIHCVGEYFFKTKEEADKYASFSNGQRLTVKALWLQDNKELWLLAKYEPIKISSADKLIEKESLKRQALSKLSLEEREALGLL